MGRPVEYRRQNRAAEQYGYKIRENFTDLFHLGPYCALPPRQSSNQNPPYLMRNVHVWKTVTEDREKREVRAERFGGKWRFQSKLKSDVPTLEDLEELRDILWRKYQRKRLPHDDVVSIDAIIAERRLLEPEALPESSTPEDDGN